MNDLNDLENDKIDTRYLFEQAREIVIKLTDDVKYKIVLT